MCSFLVIFRACQTVQGQKQRSVHRTFFTVVNRLKMKNWKSDPEVQSSTTVYFAVAVAIDFFHCSAAATGVAAGDKGHSRCRKVRRLNSLGYISRRASL